MKKRLLIVILICCIIVCISLPLSSKSYADPFTASELASASYALLNGWGISFNSTNATAAGMNSFMTSQIESYVNSQGGTIADVFVGQMAVDVAGKLVIAYDLYNCFVDFKDWLLEKFDLGTTEETIGEIALDTQGNFVIIDDVINTESGIKQTGFSCVLSDYAADAPTGRFYCNGNSVSFYTQESSTSWGYSTGWSVYYNNGWKAELYGESRYEDPLFRKGYLSGSALYGAPQSLDWNGADYSAPTVLNPDKEWTGTIGGYSEPDTNLDQLLGNINEAVADNNLVVDGEVIDVPIPTPSPMPIDPGTPLQNVPWEGLDNNLNNLYEQGLEEIGAIGDATDSITGSISNQTGVVQDLINSSTNTVSGAINQAISGQTGVVQDLINSSTNTVSGAINQAASDIQSAIGDQTAALDQSLSSTAEGVETIAEALEDEAIIWPKFNLRGLFPFCIPFDIYNMLEALDASPIAPHVQLPFVIESIGFSYTIDLDFSSFDQVAAVMRTMELIVYGIALAWATSKVIKW